MINSVSSTTDGKYLYVIDNDRDVLIQATVQGGLVREVPIPPQGTTVPYSQGAAVVGNTVYWITGNPFTIRNYNPVTGELTNERPITIASSVKSLGGTIPASGNIVESPDGNSIWMFVNSDDRVLVLDPVSAQIVDVFHFPISASGYWSAASLDGKFYFRNDQTGNTPHVYDSNLNLIGVIAGTSASSLGGATFYEDGDLVDITTDLTLNQGYQSSSATVSGTIGVDLDGNGLIDNGEMPLQGVTVFIDANGNDWPDANEPRSISNSDGSYTIANVSPGVHQLRVVAPQNYRPANYYPSSNRLFGTSLEAGSNLVRITELDPVSGVSIASSLTTIVGTATQGIAYDGERILLFDSGTDIAYELSPDGTILDQRPLGEPLPTGGFENVLDFGPVVVRGTIFSLRNSGSALSLWKYDADTNQFFYQRPITFNWNLNSLPGGVVPGLPSFDFSAGLSTDGDSIILGANGDRVLTIDPLTGIANFSITHTNLLPFDYARESIDGESFLANDTSIGVYDANGTLLRTFTGKPRFSGLGGGAHRDIGTSVSIVSGQTQSLVNFGLASTLATISGTIITDANANQLNDDGDTLLAGVAVYLDTNRNSVFDAGEPQVTTNVMGQYTFTGVSPGEYVVRQVPQPNLSSLAWTADYNRLFTRTLINSVATISELDPFTGQILRQFPSPGSITAASGLALKDDVLYLAQSGALFATNANTGATISQTSLPIGTLDGLAVIGTKAFVLHNGLNQIYVVDLGSRRIERTLDLIAANPTYGSINAILALGESADGLRLAVRNNNGTLIIDPQTGVIVDTLIGTTPFLGLAGAGGETYDAGAVTSSTHTTTEARDHLGLLRRTSVFPFVGTSANGYAADSVQANEHRIRVYADQNIVGLDFGNTAHGVINGRQFVDVNQNGVFDAGDAPLAGVKVFLDVNGNDWPDANEISTITGADGTYVLTGLTAGTYRVSTLAPAGYRASDAYTPDGRLFGVELYLDNQSPTGYFAEFWEFNPISGAVLQRVLTDIPLTTGAVGLAFDGTRLLLVDNASDMIHQLTTDGKLIASLPLGEAYFNATNGQTEYTPENDWGPAVIGGTVFTVRQGQLGGLILVEYDPVSNAFIDKRPVTYDFGTPVLTTGLLPTPPTATSAITESNDGKSILVATDDDRWMTIDPVTAVATFAPYPVFEGMPAEIAAATLGNETFVADANFNVFVYDETGNLVRTFNVPHRQYSLAGGEHRVASSTVSLGLGQSVTVDVTMSSTLSTISGSIINDANGSLTFDGGETAASGLTVFLDLNGNGVVDNGERQTVTDTAGVYRFVGVAFGAYDVTVLPPSQSIVRAWADDVTELFAYVKPNNADAFIQRVDQLTGEILNQFPSPYPTFGSVGLAVSNGRLMLATSGKLDILSPDNGTIEDTITIPSGAINGLAVIDNRAFAVDGQSERIHVIDLVRRQLIDTWELGVINHGSAGFYNIDFALGEAPDGENLLVGLQNGDALLVDSDNGVILDVWSSAFLLGGAAGAGGELFEPRAANFPDTISYQTSNLLGLSTRILPALGNGWVEGLAAEQTAARIHRVRVFAEQDVTELNFSVMADTTSISGIQFVDANANGVFDAEELPLEGITVFVDINANGFPDADEPSAISATDGTYTITNVPFGDHFVDTLPVPGYTPISSSPNQARLLGAFRLTDAQSSTGFSLQIRNLAPSGQVNSVVNTTIPVTFPDAVALVGNEMLVVDNGRDLLIRLALDGTLLSEVPLPVGNSGSPVLVYGIAVIDDTIYLMASDPNQLIRFDRNSEQFYGAMPISANTDQEPTLPAMPLLSTSVTESIDGDSIIIFSRDDDRIFKVNPFTGRIESVHHVSETGGFVSSAATVANQYLIRAQAGNFATMVLDSEFNVVSQGVNPGVSGLAGQSFVPTGVSTSSVPGISSTLNFGHRSTLTSVEGRVSRDTNQNGVLDSGEEIVDVVVYLDSNRNGLRDPAENWTTTNVSGHYVFDALLPGDYFVAVEHDSSAEHVTTAEPQDRLYSLQVDGGMSTIRRHDAITGQELASFPAPGASTVVAGLAVDELALYYSNPDGVYVLDPFTGQTQYFFDLPNGTYHGLAAINGLVFVFDLTNGLITGMDVNNGIVQASMDINAINASNYTFSAALGESLDGNRLVTRSTIGQSLVIDPTTGLIEFVGPPNLGVASLAGTADEYFVPYLSSILVQNINGVTARSLPVGFYARGLAATTVNGETYSLRAAADKDFTDRDFQLVSLPTWPDTSISGYLWQDDNNDGHFDLNEQGIVGRTVFLDLDNNGQLNIGEPSQVTLGDDPQTLVNEAGSYRFTGIASGQPQAPAQYIIRQILPAGWQATTPMMMVSMGDHATVASASLGSSPLYAPTDITLSNNSINENVDTSAADLLFASLSAIDEDPGDAHTFGLVAGTGDTDNGKFVIDGNNLKLRQGETLDYEAQSSYAVRVRVTDAGGLTFEKEVLLQVNNLIEISKSDITINDGSAQRSRVDSVTIQFGTDVILQEGAVTVHKRGAGGGLAGTVISPVVGVASRTFTLSFAGAFTEFGSLADGNYELRIDATKIISVDGFGLDTNQDGVTGDDFVFGDEAGDKFFRLFGDGNGDGVVNSTDFIGFRASYLTGNYSACCLAFGWERREKTGC